MCGSLLYQKSITGIFQLMHDSMVFCLYYVPMSDLRCIAVPGSLPAPFPPSVSVAISLNVPETRLEVIGGG